MIGRLVGVFEGQRADGSVLIDVHGVGYTLRTTTGALEEARRSPAHTTFLVHTVVREDALDLYGFKNEDELSFFKLLLEVSGVGPKTALSILNLAGLDTLRDAIAAADASYLTRVSGVGKKSAERIVVELKDKLSKAGFGESHEGRKEDGDVLDALVGLGYSLEESRAALRMVPKEAVDLQTRVREALRVLSTP